MVKNLIKNFLLVIIIFVVFSAIFSFLSGSFKPDGKVKQVPINQLANEINQGKVKQISVSGNTVSITYNDNAQGVSQKEPGTDISQTLINYGAGKDKLAGLDLDIKEQSSIWSWLAPVLYFLPILIIFLFFFSSFKQARTGAMQAFDFTKARARLFGAEGHPQEKINFADVAGLKEAKEELKEIVDFLKNPKKYLQIGARIPRGVLLLGPAGVGKTLLARAVAGEANVPFFHTSGSTFVELFVGVGASRVRDLFDTAKRAGRSIIFIDELDAIGRIRGSGIGGGHDEREQTLNQILVEMDGFERDATRIVIAATNRPDVLDPALLRPGRFDRKVILDLPDINDRKDILKIHCRGKPLASNVELREAAERTPGFSGADLANVVNEAALLAARRNKNQIFQTEFLESIEKVLLGPERKSHILSKKEKEIVAFHEAGHALVSSSIPEAEPVRKISIVARGMAAGYTLKMPTEERKIKTKSEFLAEMATFFGGYCAEKLKFREITTGASNDLKVASELARRLVKEYGMSSLGPISFGEKEEYVFLGKEISEQRNYSEEVAAKIDKEVARLIEVSRKKAESILNQRKSLLDKIAKTLIEKETIEKEEFEKLVSGKVEKNARALKKIPKVQPLKIKEIK
jgi:cell division protease FtsH